MKKTTLLAICGIMCGYANNGFAADAAIVWGAGSSLGGECASEHCSDGAQRYWYSSSTQPEYMNCDTYTMMCVNIPPNIVGGCIMSYM